MKFFKVFILILILLGSCTKKTLEKPFLESDVDIQTLMSNAYMEGLEALNKRDFLFAAKKFNEAEMLFPQSKWAPRSSLMSAYTYYVGEFYGKSTTELKRYIKIYPQMDNIDYAHYLLAMCYWESVVDEKTDLKPLVEAKKHFITVVKNFSETDYALDSKYKLELINDILASKEMYIARHYIKKEKWIAAIRRLSFVVTEFETTIFTEEALHRLVEVNYKIGLVEESKRYAKLLGYNYQSGEWYKKSYKIFNEDYEFKIKAKRVKRKKLTDKIKLFFK